VYQIGAMVKVFQDGGRQYEGCDVSIWMNGFVYQDQIGFVDVSERWIGTTTTFTQTSTVSPTVSITCSTAVAAAESGTRGVM
jgi:hypothetical protein